MGVGAVLLVLATLPILVPQFGAQPTDAGVQEIFDGVVTEPDS